MREKTTDAGRCDGCVALPGEFVCGNCYSHGESLRRGDAAADSDTGPVDDLTDLTDGDGIVWGGRSVPSIVVDTGFGSHVIVKGPNGTTYRIQPDPNGGFRFGDRGGTAENLRRVELDGGDSA